MISSETLIRTMAWNLNGFHVLEFPRMAGNAMLMTHAHLGFQNFQKELENSGVRREGN
jgi:hypothetical protein